MRVEYLLSYQCGVELVGKVNEGFVDNEGHSLLLCPLYHAEKILLLNIIARGVIGVDDNEVLDLLVAKEAHHVVCGIGEILVLRVEASELLLS